MSNSNWKKTTDRLALALGFGLMFGIILLGEGFRTQVGEVVEILLGPLPDILPFHIMLFVFRVWL